MRVLLTGITGFAGSHLAEYILANHPDVAIYATYRWRSRTENLEVLTAQNKVEMIECRYPPGGTLRDDGRRGRRRKARGVGPAAAHLPPRRAVVRAVFVRRARRHAPHQHRVAAQPARGDPASRHADPDAHRRLERGVRARPSRRGPDERDQSATAAVALRGEQGRA